MFFLVRNATRILLQTCEPLFRLHYDVMLKARPRAVRDERHMVRCTVGRFIRELRCGVAEAHTSERRSFDGEMSATARLCGRERPLMTFAVQRTRKHEKKSELRIRAFLGPGVKTGRVS